MEPSQPPGEVPRLSVVIPSHRRADLLAGCLRSVTRWAPVAAEIIVVDDASPNAAVSAVAARFPAVRCVRCPRRAGFCAAANHGIAAARGVVVELLNDDTEVAPRWANAALAHFADSAVAAVAPLVLVGPAPRIDSAGDRYYRGGIAGKRGHGEPLSAAYLQAGPVFGASASSAFYRRDVLLRVGAFPEEFGAYFEDIDLAFRIRRAGFTVIYEPRARVFHHVSASYGRPRRRLLEQQSLNEERVFWRNLPRRDLIRAFPSHLAVLAAKAERRWREGGLAPFLLGRLRLFGELPRLWEHRRRLRRLGPEADLAAWGVERHFWGA